MTVVRGGYENTLLCTLSEPRAKVGNREKRCGRKCTEVFTNTIRTSMKPGHLAYQTFGRKYVKNFAGAIAVSEKMTIFATQ